MEKILIFLIFCFLDFFLGCNSQVSIPESNDITKIKYNQFDFSQEFLGPGEYLSATHYPSVNSLCSSVTLGGFTGNQQCGLNQSIDIFGPSMITCSLLDNCVAAGGVGPLYLYYPAAGYTFNSIVIDPGIGFFPGNICTGKTIFGSLGTAVCQTGIITGTLTTPSSVYGGINYWGLSGNLQIGTLPDQGSYDFSASLSFPGSGYYSSVTASNLDASKVCASKNFQGSAGTAQCGTVGTFILSTYPAPIPSPSPTPSSAASGTAYLVDVSLTLNAPYEVLYNSVRIDLGANFLDTNFCKTVPGDFTHSIFGKNGIAICQSSIPSNNNDYGYIYDVSLSTAHRNVSSTPITQIAETTTYNGNGINPLLPNYYHAVPSISIDDSGENTSGVIKISRPLVNCGDSLLTLTEMIADCATKNPSASTWNGNTNGNAGQSTWVLVARTSSTQEAWQDLRTNLIWTSLQTSNNWCQASGNTQNVGANCQPGMGNQLLPPVSLCTEQTWASLVGSSTPISTYWRLPTRDDYYTANIDGIRFIFWGAMASIREWTATTSSVNRGFAFYINLNESGQTALRNKTNSTAFRCVGIPK